MTLLTVTVLELGLRAAGVKFEPSLYEPDAILYFVLRANAEGWTVKEGENYVRINSLGMLDRERKIEHSSDSIRVAFLGDSMLAGQQVPVERTLTQILERGLSQAARRTGRQIEVLNFAVGGYALSQMYLMLDERVWAFHPDIVAVCVSGLSVPNSYRKTKSLDGIPLFTLDHGGLVADPGNQPPAGTSAESRHWHRILGDLHNRFRVLQLIRTALQSKLQDAFVWSRPKSPTIEPPGPAEFMRVWAYRPPDSPDLATAWDITEAILSGMIDAAREHGAEFWLIQIGNDIEEDPRDGEQRAFLSENGLSDLGYANERYAAFTARHDVFYLYLAPGMREYSAKAGVPLRGFFNTPPYEGHWNEAGHAAAAQIIENQFLEKSRVLSFLKSDAKGD